MSNCTTPISLRGRRRRAGFAVAELILVLVLSTIVLSAVLAALVALLRSLQPQAVVLGGEAMPVAPTFACFPSAVAFHHNFARRITEARAVYVFGGRHQSIGAGASPTTLQPLVLQTVPADIDFTAGLPLSAEEFYEKYAAALGAQETSSNRDDFTVIAIGSRANALGITCVTQVRRREVVAGDGLTYTQREARLWDVDGSSRRYAFVEHPATAPRAFVGAVHTWLRFRAGMVREEGPACLAFPDPWLLAGQLSESAPPAFSRFSYFVALSR